MLSAGENSWWERGVAAGKIPGGDIMHHRSAEEGTYVWAWGEEPGECDNETDSSDEPCNAAKAHWEKGALVVTSPEGDSYKFRSTSRVPVGRSGIHRYGREHELFVKDSRPGLICDNTKFDDLALLAVQEVVHRLYNGADATRCLAARMETTTTPRIVPSSPSKVSPPKIPARQAVQPTLPTKPLAPPTKPLDKMCRDILPNMVMTLWSQATTPALSDLKSFNSALRCGFFYQQSKKGTGGSYTPLQAIQINASAKQMLLETKDGPQAFELLEVGNNRLWARHVDPAQWMIPPNMSHDGMPHGAYGPIDIRVLQGGELLFRYRIPSNDNKDYPYAWALVRQGKM